MLQPYSGSICTLPFVRYPSFGNPWNIMPPFRLTLPSSRHTENVKLCSQKSEPILSSLTLFQLQQLRSRMTHLLNVSSWFSRDNSIALNHFSLQCMFIFSMVVVFYKCQLLLGLCPARCTFQVIMR